VLDGYILGQGKEVVWGQLWPPFPPPVPASPHQLQINPKGSGHWPFFLGGRSRRLQESHLGRWYPVKLDQKEHTKVQGKRTNLQDSLLFCTYLQRLQREEELVTMLQWECAALLQTSSRECLWPALCHGQAQVAGPTMPLKQGPEGGCSRFSFLFFN
jgi:hypothetical protein